MRKESISVLFVCLGNICRSPTAESVFKTRVEKAGLRTKILVDSAGILSVHHGDRADRRMRNHASRRGYILESLSRPVRQEDFVRFDYIIGMDHANIRDLSDMAKDEEARSKISLFLSYAGDAAVEEVPDPYYGGAEGFEQVLDLVEMASEGLLRQLQHEI